MNEDMMSPENTTEFPRQEAAKWLRCLLYIHIASLAVSLLSLLPVADQVFGWIQRILVIGSALCLSQLSFAGERYRKAAIFKIIYAAGLLITSLFFASTAISLAASVCSLIAIYQEYSAHSELISGADPALSRKWHSLFTWSILAALLVGFGSMVLSVVAAMSGMDITALVGIVMVILSLPDMIVELFYLLYLNRTIHLLPEE